jgi:hypothetical protein
VVTYANPDIDPRTVVPTLNALLGVMGRMYMHYANTVLEHFGQPGEMTVRTHLRQFGHWRGTEMREAHHAMGRPIDMESLTCFWDNASTYVIEDDMEAGTYSPSDSQFDVHFCPAALAWKESGFDRWGHVYCDEFHQACASTYHPDGNVVIPINMMKGDDHCAFRWVLPASARPLELGEPSELGLRLARTYDAGTPGQGAVNAMLRTSRLIGGCYITMVGPLRDRHPGEADHVLRAFLRRWSTERGRLMRERTDAAGQAPTPDQFLRDMDFGPLFAWDAETTRTAGGDVELVVRDTPMDRAFADYDEGAAATIFWEESLPALAEGYGSNLTVDLPELRWRGDAATRIVVSGG